MPIKEWKIFDIDAERCRVAFYRMTMRWKRRTRDTLRNEFNVCECVCVCLCAAHAQKWLKTTLTKSGDNWTRQSRSTRTYCQFCAVPQHTPGFSWWDGPEASSKYRVIMNWKQKQTCRLRSGLRHRPNSQTTGSIHGIRTHTHTQTNSHT